MIIVRCPNRAIIRNTWTHVHGLVEIDNCLEHEIHRASRRPERKSNFFRTKKEYELMAINFFRKVNCVTNYAEILFHLNFRRQVLLQFIALFNLTLSYVLQKYILHSSL